MLDIDGDSDLDWLSFREQTGSLQWYENDGSIGASFTAQSQIDVEALFTRQVWTVDFDGDGDIDVLSLRSGPSGPVIQWHENIAPDAGDFDADSDVDGTDFLAWQRGNGVQDNAVRADGDADGDGDVQTDDLNDWQGTYGLAPTPSPIVAAAVGEEPADRVNNFWLYLRPISINRNESTLDAEQETGLASFAPQSFDSQSLSPEVVDRPASEDSQRITQLAETDEAFASWLGLGEELVELLSLGWLA